MGLLTTLCNMKLENKRHYLIDHDPIDFSISEIEEVIIYLGKDPCDFKDDDEMYMYIKNVCGCYTEEGNRWR